MGADHDRGARAADRAGCLCRLWSGEGLSIAGPDTKARVVTLAPGTRCVGVRLRPGVAGAVLRMPASELRDCTVEAADVLGYEVAAPLLEALTAGVDPHALLLRIVEERGVHEPDPLVGAAVAALGQPRARVSAVAAELGVSARQLQRLVSRCRRVRAEAACARVALSAAAGACAGAACSSWRSRPVMPTRRT